jgi:two-component sensor histidine kinase
VQARVRAPTACLDANAELELELRARALRVGFLLGCLSLAAVLGALGLDAGARNRSPLLALTLVATVLNSATLAVPWRPWLPELRGRALLDLWSAGMIAFVAVLVAAGSPNFSLLLFLAIPFVAVVQTGRRRVLWLAVAAATCTSLAVLIPLPAAATALRLSLLAATVAVALALARAIRSESAAHRRAEDRAEKERALAREANHRIKNNLQTAADLLLLARPRGAEGRAFDETAARIRSIATVHRLLTETDGPVDGGGLLRGIAEGALVPVAIEAEHVALDAATAQKLGIVVNELITNAHQHGAAPIVVRLTGGLQTRLRVDDDGVGPTGPMGLGLELVRRMVEQGLHGRFELGPRPGGGTRAEVVFPAPSG